MKSNDALSRHNELRDAIKRALPSRHRSARSRDAERDEPLLGWTGDVMRLLSVAQERAREANTQGGEIDPRQIEFVLNLLGMAVLESVIGVNRPPFARWYRFAMREQRRRGVISFAPAAGNQAHAAALVEIVDSLHPKLIKVEPEAVDCVLHAVCLMFPQGGRDLAGCRRAIEIVVERGDYGRRPWTGDVAEALAKDVLRACGVSRQRRNNLFKAKEVALRRADRA